MSGNPRTGYCASGKRIRLLVLTAILALILLPTLAGAGDFTGGKPVVTVQNGTVTGDLWFDVMPAPNWGSQNIVKTFTLPENAVAEPGRIRWARLYVSAYCSHMQDDKAFTITNRWDGDGTGGYEQVWPEIGHAPFHFIVDPVTLLPLGNDNSAFPGHGTGEPYKMINDHETRVTSDYLMWYDVKDLIKNQTIFLNVDTRGSVDGRIKVTSLVVAYDDPASTTQTTYWVNEGHDALSYYTETSYGYVEAGSTEFGTRGADKFTSAILTIDHMASSGGVYGFPDAVHDQTTSPSYIEFARQLPADGMQNVQGSYSGVVAWDVTSRIPRALDGNTVSDNVTFGYARNVSATGLSAFFKLPLAILVLKSPLAAAVPVADFTANQSSGTVPLAVQFNDTTTGSPATWNWTFGDTGAGNTSVLRNVSHTYTVPGTYNVTLTVTSASGSNTTVKREFITAIAPPVPVADFVNTTPRSGTAPLTVQFNDTSTGSPSAWSWTFGDIGTGNTSNLRNASHTYASPGTYHVNLSVTGPGGTNFTVKQNYVTISSLSGVPVAAFSATPLSGTVPLTVSFSDQSAGSPTSWAWDFNNDGVVDNTTQNPVYIYTSTGSYTVKLNATNANGSDDEIRTGYIAVFSGNVALVFDPSVRPVNTSETQDIRIVMDNAPAGLSGYDLTLRLANPGIAEITGVTYPSWAQLTRTPLLPNQTVLIGGVDTNHLIEPGATAITLATIRVRGNMTGMTPVLISVVHPDDDDGEIISPTVNSGTVVVGTYTGPIANFSANVTSGPANLTVQFSDLSSGSPYSWAWDFNNDGIVDSTLQNPSCTYTDAGSYAINLTVANTNGLHTLVKPGYITVSSGTIPPVAAFSGTPRSGTAPLSVTFTDSSTNSPTSWAWDFGDGNTSTLKNPSNTYSNAGTFTVKLTAANAAGSDTSTRTQYITVSPVNANAPVASFTASQSSGTVPLTVTFTDTSTGSPTSWLWDFGNDQTGLLNHKTVTYTSTGRYTVTLTVTNAYGSSATTQTIEVTTDSGVPGVSFSATPTSGVIPLSVSFTDQSSGSPTSWEWDFDDDGDIDSTIQNPAYTYSASGAYTVKLTATNGAGSNSLTKSSYITATSSQTSADLTIPNIVPNLGGTASGSIFALEPNPVTIVIRNNGTEASPATTVKLEASDGFSGSVSVPVMAAGANITVPVTDTTVRSSAGSSLTYTATVDPDSLILETSESNNKKTFAGTVKYNGYKGKRYWSGGNDVITRQTYDLHGGLEYSRGDSVYRSGSFGDGGWLSYTVNWKDTEPTIPSGATIKAAYLYVPYTWDNENIAPDHTFIDFNGQRVSRTSWYTDRSNFGVYSDYAYGLLKYDVTSLYKKNEANNAVFTRENPNYSDPAKAAVYTKLSMYEFFLVVVYEDSDSTRKQIFINDNFDLLGASAEYSTTSKEATAYVPFTGMTVDTANLESATLTTFVPSGLDHEGNILYNDNIIASNVWDYGLPAGVDPTGADGIPQVAVDTRDVTSHIQSSGNIFAIQSSDTGGTPCMAAIQQFLIIDLGDSTTTTTTTTTATTTTTKTTVETIATYKDGATVTLASGQGSAGSGSSGAGTSNSGGTGVAESGNPSSGQQGSRNQAGPAEQPETLDGVAMAGTKEEMPFGLLLGGIFMIGATSAVAYRKGWIPPVSPMPDAKNGQCIWDGTGSSASCQTFDIENGIIRYHPPGFLNLSLTHRITIGLVIACIVLAGAAWYLGFLSGGSSGLSSSSGDVQAGNFDIIPTIESIRDLDMTNRIPDYPAGFSARNGLLFVYHGTDTPALTDISLELSKGTNTVTLTSSTLMPSPNAANAGPVPYFEEMGNGDGILDPEEWLMVYSDNCYDSSGADGEPKGRVLVWQPQDAGSMIEVPLKDTVKYSLRNSATGTILQQGTVLLVPATT